ncbi:hypothetical protein [Saccharopolyspora halophila]|uniref:hypothetical protein n=1 Tax=Saccharopolyspora halophila TaxID=405551 RepID=UPI0031DEE841
MPAANDKQYGTAASGAPPGTIFSHHCTRIQGYLIMQSNNHTFVSVVGTVAMVVMTVVLAAVSPQPNDQQVEPAAEQHPIAVAER